MSILLAVGNPDLTELLRQTLVTSEFDFDLIDNDVFHRKYLDEIIRIEKPETIILHDVYLPSDPFSSKEKDEEMLRYIENWRTLYDKDLRVVYLCEREKKDPFLGDLVARNVLDIFNERTIQNKLFIEQLAEPPHYANVAKFGIGALDVEFDEEVILPIDEGEERKPSGSTTAPTAPSQNAERAKQLLINLSDKAKSVVDAGNEWNQQRIKEKEDRVVNRPSDSSEKAEKKEEPSKRGVSGKEFTEYLDLMPIPKETYGRTTVIGTVVIGVAGAKSHLGATHTAMSVASFLKKRRHSVALIEVNHSEDYDRIHSLYEGEKQYIRNQTMFEIEGIDHYKYREDLRIGEIMATYEYVVLDVGSIEDSPFVDEFKRAHVRLLLVSPYEWKQHWLEQFCQQVEGEEDYTYVVPFAGKSNVQDMEERFPELTFVPFPANHNPYKVNEAEDEAIQTFMHGFLKENSRVFSKNTIIAACAISVMITVGVISAFAWL